MLVKDAWHMKVSLEIVLETSIAWTKNQRLLGGDGRLCCHLRNFKHACQWCLKAATNQSCLHAALCFTNADGGGGKNGGFEATMSTKCHRENKFATIEGSQSMLP